MHTWLCHVYRPGKDIDRLHGISLGFYKLFPAFGFIVLLPPSHITIHFKRCQVKLNFNTFIKSMCATCGDLDLEHDLDLKALPDIVYYHLRITSNMLDFMCNYLINDVD